tara:strand:+ start:56112 stop:56618 length:507 start_codon:yes stop_codon:yes gene_type:complete
MKKIKRYIIPIVIVITVVISSYFLVHYTEVELFTIFDAFSLFTYFGVLIGFAITIYTFGLSMISDIKKHIDNIDKLTDDDKSKMFTNLKNGFSQIKQNIWLIFIGIILVIIFSILKDIENPFGWKTEKYLIPEVVNLSLFILSTIAMYDIMKTMFNLSEINMELIKNN